MQQRCPLAGRLGKRNHQPGIRISEGAGDGCTPGGLLCQATKEVTEKAAASCRWLRPSAPFCPVRKAHRPLAGYPGRPGLDGTDGDPAAEHFRGGGGEYKCRLSREVAPGAAGCGSRLWARDSSFLVPCVDIGALMGWRSPGCCQIPQSVITSRRGPDKSVVLYSAREYFSTGQFPPRPLSVFRSFTIVFLFVCRKLKL